MSLDDIVQVNISTQTTAVSQAGFGTPLIAAFHNHFPERVRSYTSLAGLVADGFSTTEAAYLAAQAILSQTPKLPRFKVGRRALAHTQILRITPSLPSVLGVTVYTVTINGVAFAFTSDATPTVAEVTAGLTTLINAGSEPMTAVDATTHVTLTADVAGAVNRVELSTSTGKLLTRQDLTVDPGIATDLSAIDAEDPDWYGLIIDNQSKAEIVAAAAWAEARIKLFGATTADADVLVTGSGDLASSLKASGYARTYLLWASKPHDYGAAGWMGRLFPLDPGSATWKFKSLAGVAVDTYTDAQRTQLRAKNANWYESVGGVGITQEGWTPAGEFIDVTHGVDWLRARLQERIYSRLVNLDKVPYTNAGASLIESEIRAQLNEGIGNNFLAADPEPTVSVPDVATVSPIDKAARLLPDVTFAATLAGAIHKVVINGVVSA